MGPLSVSRRAEIWAACAGLGAGLASVAPAVRCGGAPCGSCGACFGAAAVVSLFVVRRLMSRSRDSNEAAGEAPAEGKGSGSPKDRFAGSRF